MACLSRRTVMEREKRERELHRLNLGVLFIPFGCRMPASGRLIAEIVQGIEARQEGHVLLFSSLHKFRY